MKLCKRCGTIKPKTDFTPCKVTSDKCQAYCKACYAERRKEYRNAHPEKAKASDKAARVNNKEKIAARKLAYRLNNVEKVKAARKLAYSLNRETELAKALEYKKSHADELKQKQSARHRENPHIGRYYRAVRRAIERNARVRWANRFFVKEAYHLAALRTKVTGIVWHVDHIVPLKSKLVCGLHCESNLAIIPAGQNISKSNRYWPDMPA